MQKLTKTGRQSALCLSEFELRTIFAIERMQQKAYVFKPSDY